jgi:holo-[acyl-carrier protein] synthase
MIVGLGIDIVDNNRIKKIYDKFGDKFLNKICTINEINYITKNKSKLIYKLANRFAAKEAFYKALGHSKYETIPSWKEAEIVNSIGGKPFIKVFGQAEKLCLDLIPKTCSYKLHISLSDEKDYSNAIVIIESIGNAEK